MIVIYYHKTFIVQATGWLQTLTIKIRLGLVMFALVPYIDKVWAIKYYMAKKFCNIRLRFFYSQIRLMASLHKSTLMFNFSNGI
jgi:hypothetical protein